MPDPNKLMVLTEQQYRIIPTCGVCQHGLFVGNSDWGSCQVMSYQHQKHTNIKFVSIHRSGSCPQATISDQKKTCIAHSGFDIFLKKE